MTVFWQRLVDRIAGSEGDGGALGGYGSPDVGRASQQPRTSTIDA